MNYLIILPIVAAFLLGAGVRYQKYEDIEKDGLSYVLYNNVWGTNFPLWYEDNAKFVFRIRKVGE